MTTSQQFRARAVEFEELIKRADHPDAIRELQKQQRALTELADNEDWSAENRDKTVHPESPDVHDGPILAEDDPIIPEDGAHILACLGTALIMRWNTLPTKLQKELFNDASSMRELLQTDALKRRIACFLHKHKDDTAASISRIGAGERPNSAD
jgi:hypothetical protein